MRNVKIYLKGILESVEAIKKFVGGIDFGHSTNQGIDNSVIRRAKGG